MAAAALVLTSGGQIRHADACGCFTPPDPSVPVVQAGERILFAQDSGKVIAHIQIQYAGDAAEFGWILPLPSVPTLELGTDELFNQLITQTQPKYRMSTVYDGNCGRSTGGFGGGTATAEDGSNGPPVPGAPGTKNIVVIQDAIGPYDYAVLRADNRNEMLSWLSDNRYFVPGGTDDAVKPYIKAGAYFLALKLRSGKSTGDLQPVVVKYDSDKPMIPIVLTSVAAQPDMGIQVWMVGQGRAIPRNYFHTVINDSAINWFTAGANYNDVIIAATKEAEGRHTFVTEYAGSSQIMRQVLDPPGRFGDREQLAATTDPVAFVTYLNNNGFPTQSQQNGPGPIFVRPVYPSQLLSLLGGTIPVPDALAKKGVGASDFYGQIGYYLGAYRTQYPQDFVGYTVNFKPREMADDIWMRVVAPTLAAGKLFADYPYLTRLYTTLSPEQMDRDPVFSENKMLPGWGNVHEATLTIHCGLFGGNFNELPATLKTEQGWVIEYPDGAPTGVVGPTTPNPVPSPLPASERIEIVSEEGAPSIVTNNHDKIGEALDSGGGCQVAPGGRGRGVLTVGLLFLALIGLSRALVTKAR